MLGAASTSAYRARPPHHFGQQLLGCAAMREEMPMPPMGGEEGIVTAAQMRVQHDGDRLLTDAGMDGTGNQPLLVQLDQCVFEVANEQGGFTRFVGQDEHHAPRSTMA